MVYNSNWSQAEMLHGPYEVMLGSDGSEETLGSILDLAYNPGLTITEFKGGDLVGRETVLDIALIGVNPKCAFMIRQTTSTALYRAFPYLTNSSGAVSYALSINVKTHGGLALRAHATRIRLHPKNVSDYTDKTKDLIFPKGIIVPEDTMNDYSGQDFDGIACMLIALPDDNGLKTDHGIDAAA